MCMQQFTIEPKTTCKFCWQSEPDDHVCQIVRNCSTTSVGLHRAVCRVKEHVTCIGRRSFYKNVRCNWTNGYSWWKAMFLSVTLGGFGVDRFYLGLWKSAIGKLFSFGGLGIWTIVDIILIVLLINLYAINGDEDLLIEPTETRSTLRNGPECRSECLLSNTCGSWLENTSAKSGLYRLHQRLELSCQFLSAPTPVAVAWKFKTTTENVWRDVSCNVTTNYECNVTKLGEHRSTSFCTAEKVNLEMGGIYRCETLDSKETVYSSEIRVDVVGIQSAVQTSEHLHFGKPGYIEVQICSNPMAHPFWTDDEIVLQSSQSGNGLAVTSLLPARTESLLELGPTHHIPYCYVNRIIIAKVDERVKRLKLIVSLHEDMRSVDLSFHAKLKTKLKHQPRHNAASNHLYVCCSNLVMLLIVSIIYNKSY